ncbi:(2Fe-2S)-binding protein [Paenalkalicoccus suaedae]|uniref:(2Fe-2S)-binding protein n=1 Tax=Paenalkalicoccus suaedae TaxID=2592382 RepID=A0A859FK11_9BACI|nr:IucA/IucC family C-terminal-domain containing protein [Paenalkalicoccus suaedae]QKS73151.1 (2Fe-2S)-binding protein [Paenalkalicoccus suaedae]
MISLQTKLLEETFITRVEDHPRCLYAVTLADLLDKSRLADLIAFYQEKLKSCHPAVTGTYFSGYFGNFLGGVHYMLAENAAYDWSLTNIELQLVHHAEHNYFGFLFKIKDDTMVELDAATRDEQVRERLTALYRDSVTPLLETFAEVADIRIRELWGQLNLGIHYGFDRVVDLGNPRAEGDMRFLTEELDGSIFNAKKNPLAITFRLVDSYTGDGEQLRMKPSCCLYYQLEGAAAKCFTCPRLKESDRELRREAFREKQA